MANLKAESGPSRLAHTHTHHGDGLGVSLVGVVCSSFTCLSWFAGVIVEPKLYSSVIVDRWCYADLKSPNITARSSIQAQNGTNDLWTAEWLRSNNSTKAMTHASASQGCLAIPC
ncbi:hypothetical protein LY76DRAFT_235808 [Colletotrichum caudatum]|nr:hypothetical protein LY76DRAFT_235808 [Colletotrichum caudatum]